MTDKKEDDIVWLRRHRKDLTCDQIDNFVERVGIKQDSNINEQDAREQAFEELFT